MSLADRILSGLKSVILIEDKVAILAALTKDLKSATEAKLANHENRLTRIETIIELTRPDGTTLRIAPQKDNPS